MCVSAYFHRKVQFRFRLRFLQKTVRAVPVLGSVPGQTVPAVPVSSSGLVPGPFCLRGQKQYPKDPAVLRKLHDSKFTMHSQFTFAL